VLKFAHEHGCGWDERTIDSARDSGCADTIEYVRANGCPTGYIQESEDESEDESKDEIQDETDDEGDDNA